jgi:hypothetical protein
VETTALVFAAGNLLYYNVIGPECTVMLSGFWQRLRQFARDAFTGAARSSLAERAASDRSHSNGIFIPSPPGPRLRWLFWPVVFFMVFTNYPVAAVGTPKTTFPLDCR